MNGKEKMVHQKKWAFSWFLKFCRESDDRIVAGSLFRDAGLVNASAWSPKLVFECGTRRSLCAAEWSRERAVIAACGSVLCCPTHNLINVHYLHLWIFAVHAELKILASALLFSVCFRCQEFWHGWHQNSDGLEVYQTSEERVHYAGWQTWSKGEM